MPTNSNIRVTETTPLLIEARQGGNSLSNNSSTDVLVITVDDVEDANAQVQAVAVKQPRAGRGSIPHAISEMTISSSKAKDPGDDADDNDTRAHADSEALRTQLGPMEISSSNRRFILAGIWMGTFLASLNGTLVATLVSSISSEYQASNQASWLGTGYLLATCTFTPLYGRLCDMLGRRRAHQTAVLFACLGTLCCGLSRNMPMLIAARFLSGVGGGGSYVTASVITSDMYSLRHRSLTQGIASVFNAAGQAVGGPVGGFISDRFGWRWAFLLQMPIYVVSFFMTEYNLNYVTPGKSKNAKEAIKRIDYGGSISLFLSIGSLLAFLSFKYNEELPLTSPRVLTTLIASIVMPIIFVFIELFVAEKPIMAPSLLKQRIPILVGMSNFLISMANYCSLFFFPMFFETVMLTSASTAGSHLLPKSIGMTSGSLLAGMIMSKTGRYGLLCNLGGLGAIISTFLVANMDENSNIFVQWFAIAPLGLGSSIVNQATLISLLANVHQSQIAVATGFGQLWKCIGQVTGVAIPSAVFQHLLTRELTTRIVGSGSDEIINRIRHSSKLVQTLPPDLQRAARDSYQVALGTVFWYLALSTVVAFVIRFGIPAKALVDDTSAVDHKEQTRTRTSSATSTDNAEDEDEQSQPRIVVTTAFNANANTNGNGNGNLSTV